MFPIVIIVIALIAMFSGHMLAGFGVLVGGMIIVFLWARHDDNQLTCVARDTYKLNPPMTSEVEQMQASQQEYIQRGAKKLNEQMREDCAAKMGRKEVRRAFGRFGEL